MTHCVSYLTIVTTPNVYQDVFGYQKDTHDAWVGLNQIFDIIPTLTYETWYDIRTNNFSESEVSITDADYHETISELAKQYPRENIRMITLLENNDTIHNLAYVLYIYIKELLDLLWRLQNLLGYIPSIANVIYDLNQGLVQIAYDVKETSNAGYTHSL